MDFDIEPSNVYIALLHWPVYNKSGEVVTTAITNLDLHDIARTAKTFALGGYFVVNPMEAQRELAGRILSHWLEGFGATYNPNRGEALGTVFVESDFEAAKERVRKAHGRDPAVIATCAREMPGAAGYGETRARLAEGRPHIIAFGTGWGLTNEFISASDVVLKPITGLKGYNHLPVRSAVSIILDRLLSDRA